MPARIMLKSGLGPTARHAVGPGGHCASAGGTATNTLFAVHEHQQSMSRKLPASPRKDAPWSQVTTAMQASAPRAALFAGVVELRQAPVNEPQFPLLVVDHHLPQSMWRDCYVKCQWQW